MSFSLRRRCTALLGVSLVMANQLVLPGCAPVPVPPMSGDVELSASRLDPGQFLTLSHDGIEAGIPQKVDFNGPGGYAVTVLSHDVEDGRVRVAVPVFADFTVGTIGAADVTVSIRGIEGQAALHINDLPSLDGVEPGAILALFLRSAIEDYQKTLDNLATIEAEVGQGESPLSVDGLHEQIDRLQATLTELETTGQLVVDMEGIGTAVLTEESLKLGDRLLVSMFADLGGGTGSTGKGSVSFRDYEECVCVPDSSNGFRTCPPVGLSLTDCLREWFGGVLTSIRTETLPAVETAGRVATAAGLVVAAVAATTAVVAATPVVAVGAASAAGTIALTGLLVSVMGGVVSVGSAALQGKNTDDFLQDSGEEFNVGLEMLSQGARVLLDAASTGLEPLENLFSSLITWTNRAVPAMDAWAGQKCADEPQQKSRQPLLAEGGFCSIVRPPGCDNTCATAFDGVCDDGGAGASSSVCASGTDCVDCGPRGDDGVTDGNGGGTDGAAAFTIIGFVNTDGTIGSGPSLDPSGAQIQLSGDAARPTISWAGVSSVFSLMVTTSSGFFAQALYGIEGQTPPDENGDTEQVAFGFSSVTYGTFGLTNTVAMQGPAGPLGPADATPLSPGMLVSVTVFTLNVESATLSFQVN